MSKRLVPPVGGEPADNAEKVMVVAYVAAIALPSLLLGFALGVAATMIIPRD